jgi:hypothetical protein
MYVQFKIRSVNDGCAWGWGPMDCPLKRIDVQFKIRSVSDGSAWGWGPTRTNKWTFNWPTRLPWSLGRAGD